MKALEHAVFKTAAAFLNSDGGALLLGLGDDGEVVGVEREYATVRPKQDRDSYERWLLTALATATTDRAIDRHVTVEWLEVQGHDICVVRCQRSSQAVYVRLNKEGKPLDEQFYVRRGNQTVELKTAAAVLRSGAIRRLLALTGRSESPMDWAAAPGTPRNRSPVHAPARAPGWSGGPLEALSRLDACLALRVNIWVLNEGGAAFTTVREPPRDFPMILRRRATVFPLLDHRSPRWACAVEANSRRSPGVPACGRRSILERCASLVSSRSSLFLPR